MEAYINEYVLPLTTGPNKSRKRTSKFYTLKKIDKKREQDLGNIAKNLMSILQAHGITAQTTPYP